MRAYSILRFAVHTKVCVTILAAASFQVHDYGAKGDGVTDDTAAFQDAANRIAALGGGVIFVPAASYAFQARLLRAHIDVYAADPHLTAMLVWVLRDYPLTPTFSGGSISHVLHHLKLIEGINQKGLFTYSGTPKPAAAVVDTQMGSYPPFLYVPTGLAMKGSTSFDGAETRDERCARWRRSVSRTRPPGPLPSTEGG